MFFTLTLTGLYLLFLIGGNESLRRISHLVLVQYFLFYSTLWYYNISDFIMFDIILLNDSRLLSILGCIFLCYLALTLLHENYLIFLTIVFSLLSLLESYDLILTFVSLELLNLSLYLYISNYTSGVKYFLLSGIITTLFLLGIASIYSQVGNTHYDALLGEENVLILIVLLFKLGIFPFQGLTADLYDGISTSIMCLFQIPVKYTYLLLTYYMYNVLSLSPITLEYISILMIISMVFTAIVLSAQYTMRRFLAISSISYQSMLMMLLLSGLSVYFEDILVYLVIYFISLYLILISNHPFILSLTLFSIAGLPPLAGFFTKLYVLQDLLILYQGWSLYIIMFLISSLILTANYLGLIVSNLFVGVKVVETHSVPVITKSILLLILIFYILL